MMFKRKKKYFPLKHVSFNSAPARPPPYDHQLFVLSLFTAGFSASSACVEETTSPSRCLSCALSTQFFACSKIYFTFMCILFFAPQLGQSIISYNWSVGENRAVPIPHSSSRPGYSTSQSCSSCSATCGLNCFIKYVYPFYFILLLLGLSAWLFLQCHMWAILHPYSKYNTIISLFHFSTIISYSVRANSHYNYFHLRPLFTITSSYILFGEIIEKS